jgi:hypothetical protein
MITNRVATLDPLSQLFSEAVVEVLDESLDTVRVARAAGKRSG